MIDSPHIVEVTRDNYAELMEASFRVPVLLDFWAGWCQPCQVLMPVLAKLADEYQGKFVLGKLDTEQEQEIAARFGIRSIPTVKLFRNGEPVDEFMGALPQRAIRQFLDRHIPRESDAQITSAQEILASGDIEGALDLLQKARESDPDNTRVSLALASAQAAAGLIDAAGQTLASLPADEQLGPEAAAIRNRLIFESELAGAPGANALAARLENDASDIEAMYKLAIRRVLEEDYDSGTELLLQLMRKDRKFGDDAARRALLKVFELLGDDPRVGQYRRRMAGLLH